MKNFSTLFQLFKIFCGHSIAVSTPTLTTPQFQIVECAFTPKRFSTGFDLIVLRVTQKKSTSGNWGFQVKTRLIDGHFSTVPVLTAHNYTRAEQLGVQAKRMPRSKRDSSCSLREESVARVGHTRGPSATSRDLHGALRFGCGHRLQTTTVCSRFLCWDDRRVIEVHSDCAGKVRNLLETKAKMPWMRDDLREQLVQLYVRVRRIRATLWHRSKHLLRLPGLARGWLVLREHPSWADLSLLWWALGTAGRDDGMAVRGRGSYRECFLEVSYSGVPELVLYVRNCFIDYLWSDHLSSCQLCCCHTFQIEDHSCELHQDVEDHWEEEDDVGSSRSFAKYCSQFVLNHSGYSRILGSSLSFNRFLSFVGISFLVSTVVESRISLISLP